MRKELVFVIIVVLVLFLAENNLGPQAISGAPATSPFQTVTLEALSISAEEVSLVGEASLNIAWPDRDSDPRAFGKSVILVDGVVAKVCGGAHRGFHKLERPLPEPLQPCAYNLDLSALSSGPHIVRYEVKANAFTSASFTQPASGGGVAFCDGVVRSCVDQVHYCEWIRMAAPTACGGDGSLESAYLSTGGPSDAWFAANWHSLSAPVFVKSNDLVVTVGGSSGDSSTTVEQLSLWEKFVAFVSGVLGALFGVFS